MQRLIVHGVPYYVDSQNKLFTYDTESVCIGTYTDGEVAIDANLREQLKSKVTEWRSKQQPRTRKPQENT
jgi:hypothetical protein